MNFAKIIVVLFIVQVVYSSERIKPVYHVENLRNTKNGLKANLKLSQGSGPFGDDIKNLDLNIFFETETRVRIKITDRNEKRWEGK